MTMNCPVCGAENTESAEFCNLCIAGMGFENPEYTDATRVDGGYLEHYPSSFDSGAPGNAELAGSTQASPEVPSVDIGEYGASSGQEFEPRQVTGLTVGGNQTAQTPHVTEQALDATWQSPPMEGGTNYPYGGEAAVAARASQVGINTAEPFPAPAGPAPQQAYGSRQAPMQGGAWQDADRVARPEPGAVRVFDWTRAITLCAAAAAIAALMSVSLELFLSFIGYVLVVSGSFTKGMIVVFVSLLIPVVFAGFSPGYRMERNGWALGLIAVGMWAFAFRPLYFAILSWMLTDRFSFAMVFSKFNLAFIFGLFLPLGAFLGWLGERRATTGLFF